LGHGTKSLRDSAARFDAGESDSETAGSTLASVDVQNKGITRYSQAVRES